MIRNRREISTRYRIGGPVLRSKNERFKNRHPFTGVEESQKYSCLTERFCDRKIDMQNVSVQHIFLSNILRLQL